MAKEKDKKASRDSSQEQKAPAQAQHSAKERPRLRSRFEKEVAPALLKDAGAQRDFLYGRAMARVVAHELYHILMQTTEHARSGVARSCFSTEDLLTERFEFESTTLAQMRRKQDNGSSAGAFTEDGSGR